MLPIYAPGSANVRDVIYQGRRGSAMLLAFVTLAFVTQRDHYRNQISKIHFWIPNEWDAKHSAETQARLGYDCLGAVRVTTVESVKYLGDRGVRNWCSTRSIRQHTRYAWIIVGWNLQNNVVEPANNRYGIPILTWSLQETIWYTDSSPWSLWKTIDQWATIEYLLTKNDIVTKSFAMHCS